MQQYLWPKKGSYRASRRLRIPARKVKTEAAAVRNTTIAMVATEAPLVVVRTEAARAIGGVDVGNEQTR